MTSAPTNPHLSITASRDLLPAVVVTRFRANGKTQDRPFLPILTLVLWASCLSIGAVGLTLHYSRPRVPEKPLPPIQAELLNIELTNDPLPPPDVAPPPTAIAKPPPLTAPVAPPAAPPMAAVAEPAPAIAFAVPVEGPVQIVEAKQADPVAVPAPTVARAPAVQAITHGQGEGRQPAPIYPSRALREGQEGTVRVRFSVGENGRVASAEASTPSPWSLLNHEAVRVVRERWRFRPGPARLYEVSIRFELQK